MKIYKYKIRSTPGSNLMFGKPYMEKMKTGETHAQFEERCWKQKVPLSGNQCLISGFAVRNALESAASRLQMKVPSSKGTFTKLIKQGCLCYGPFLLHKHDGNPLTLEDIEPLLLFVPSDGKRGSAKRVERVFPQANEWMTEVEVHVLDERITEEVMREHIAEVGRYIGFGSMRVENGGMNGRFEVVA